MRDAERAIHLRPEWAKGYYREGEALAKMGRHEEVREHFFHQTVLCKIKTKFVSYLTYFFSVVNTRRILAILISFVFRLFGLCSSA